MTKCCCPTCNQTIDISYPLNVGEFSKSSGWKPLIVEDNILWLCPFHKERVENLSKKILDIVGTEHVFFKSLLNKVFLN